ncbi:MULTISPECIES: hypothetical protein [unclassified Acinetobacter]|uniref:hypothetical protein n=1 Tax=unclassified Acinetobacter TaxID=196816 RepID=UPI00244914A2|nr:MULTISPECIES: hypothetical protein [unclassified Acinetobacter]MDH0031329.1 hypothetical protein [Acinetobacter sp. GD04021]MDH0887186.1 hypothetical protein [Acinetobacter sp. GD03873]MDH1083525.1 hypothetical protein [Acinetobacter sp. GD03983]MDH2190502.1 hypothetical protein [Acinetobacter sp. GD03645]MDH2204052.1 hypothetical protein [Acinetobacter sp. GD03647]
MNAIVQPSAEKQVKTYDAGDLLDVYAVAHESTEWLSTLITQIKKEMKKTQTDLEERGIHPATFYTLESLLGLTEYFAEDRANFFDVQREEYEKEWEATK